MNSVFRAANETDKARLASIVLAAKAFWGYALTCAASHGFGFLTIDSYPNAEPFYASCGAQRVSLSLAPIDGDPARVRSQMVLSTT